MPADLSSVAREAAEQSGHYPETMLGHRQLQRAYALGFTECASRLLGERDIEIAAADAIQSKAKLSQNFALPTVEMIEKVLADNGLSGLGELHGWRCNHPEVYGECRCVSELIDDLAALFGEAAGDE